MRLKSIQIENVGCIRNLKINELHPHMNVLTGLMVLVKQLY